MFLAAGIAHHYTIAGDQPAAFTASLRAAEASERVHAYGETAALLERALDLWPRVRGARELAGTSRAELLLRAGQALTSDGEYPRAVAMLEEALAQVDRAAEPHLAANTLERLAKARWSLGDADAARRLATEALELLPADDESLERARLLAWEAKACMLFGRYGEVIPAAAAAIEAADRVGATESRAEALNALGVALIARGEIEEGTASLEESIALATTPWTGSSGYVNLADALNLAGHSERALEIALAGLGWARAQGRAAEWLQMTVAEIGWDLGDWDLARDHMAASEKRFSGITLAFRRLRVAEFELADGRHDEARAALERVADIVAGSREPQFIGWAGALRAELERRCGDVTAARTAVDDALDAIEYCSEDLARIARLAEVGAAIEADAAQRARDLGDEEAERLAIARAEAYVLRLEACAGEEARPVERARLCSGAAELERARGASDPAAYAAAAEAWSASRARTRRRSPSCAPPRRTSPPGSATPPPRR